MPSLKKAKAKQKRAAIRQHKAASRRQKLSNKKARARHKATERRKTRVVRPAVKAPAAQSSQVTPLPLRQTTPNGITFRVGEHVVYPTHGVGQITAIQEQEIAGLKLQLFVVFFAKDRMTLRVPISKVANVRMRKVSEQALVNRALDTLKGRPRIKRTMWSRRAQEYEAKINSGDLIAVAEVVRDLFRADTQPEQSYSERQLYEAALDRMMRELAIVHKVSDDEARHTIETMLMKGPRRRAATEDNVVALKADNDVELKDKAA